MVKLFEVKEGIKLEDLKEMHPALFIMLTRTLLYCQEFGLPCVVTSIKGDRDKIKTSSTTHAEGRAIDISVKGWSDQHIHRFVFNMNRWYADIAAISASDMQPRAAVYHDAGYGPHLHIQCKANAEWRDFVN